MRLRVIGNMRARFCDAAGVQIQRGSRAGLVHGAVIGRDGAAVLHGLDSEPCYVGADGVGWC